MGSNLMPSFLNTTKDLQDHQDPILGQERRGQQPYHHSMLIVFQDTDAGQLYSNMHSFTLGFRFKKYIFKTDGEAPL